MKIRTRSCSLDAGATLAICNQGTILRPVETRSNLAYVDVETGELLESHELERDDVLMAHMRAFDDQELVIVTKSKTESSRGNDIYTHRRGEELRQLDWPLGLTNTFIDEILSIDCDDRRRRIGATCPDAGKVVFWDVNAREVLTVHDLERPLGIALTGDGRHWIVNDIAGGTYAFDGRTLELSDRFLPQEIADATFTAPHSLITAG